tara:strand:+ start:7603 stop:10500 length:2898 start_codon:yes stop_codon:yes gene_type:complete
MPESFTTSYFTDYIELTSRWKEIYGEQTIVVMQYGNHFEVYDMDADTSVQIRAFVEHLDLTKFQKSHISKGSKVWAAGFPVTQFDKYAKRLLEHNFTIVKIVQSDETILEPSFKDTTKSRRVECVLSPGCNLLNEIQSVMMNFLIIETEGLITLNFSRMDVSIGIVEYAAVSFNNFGVAMKFITDLIYEVGKCDELLFYVKFASMSLADFLKFVETLNVVSKHFVNLNELSSKNSKAFVFNTAYQSKYLQTIFSRYNHIGVTITESLKLENATLYEIASIILLLTFVSSHDEKLVKDLPLPCAYYDGQHSMNTVCLNSLLERMDVFSDRGLYSMFCKQNTKMGQRYLRHILRSPTYNVSLLKERYDCMSRFHSCDCGDNISNLLLKISDMERLKRKISLGRVIPSDIVKCVINLKTVIQLVSTIEDFNLTCSLLDLKQTTQGHVEDCICFIEDVFDLKACEMNQYVVQRDKFEEIETMLIEEARILKQIEGVIKMMNDFLLMNGTKEPVIKLERSSSNEFSLVTTKIRGETLQRRLNSWDFSYSESFANLEHAKVVFNGNSCRIHGFFDQLLVDYGNLIEANRHVMKKYFYENVAHIFAKTEVFFQEISQYIAIVDVFHSMGKLSRKHGYVQPIISDTLGQVCAKQIRHPIIERLVVEDNRLYIPNDVQLDPFNSWLLFGPNSVGKSSLLKSIVLNTVVAQCGFFVAAKEFVYNPFKFIGCRIGNDDDIFLGRSSYTKECIELNAILHQACAPSLIITDEMCASTDPQSELLVNAAFIRTLSERRITFACATHRHELLENGFIKGLSHLKKKHLKVRFDHDTVIFERILSDGCGDTSQYGLKIASLLIHDRQFQQYLHSKFHFQNDSLISVSKYNKKSIRTECQVPWCKYKPMKDTDKQLHTHHLQFQCHADINGNVENGMNKDNLSNLVTLCEQCHRDVHADLIVIECEETMQGRQLTFRRNAE